MCNACAFACCGSDEFERCGCDGCFEPACWDDADDLDFDDSPFDEGDDEDDGGLCLPLAACGCAPARGRFRCEAVA